jgi:protein TonB
MFDKLVESAKQKQGRRAGRVLALTTAVYCLTLAVFIVTAIVGFNPALAEEYGLLVDLMPPVPQNSQPATAAPLTHKPVQVVTTFSVPRTPVEIPPASEADKYQIVKIRGPLVPGAPPGPGNGLSRGVFGGNESGDPPPPPPTPAPVPKPAQTEATDQRVVRLTSQLTQGRAIRRSEPAYPSIARQVRVQGAVQVQISISETGEVTDAFVMSGHPLLRDVSVQAARQWLFRPTELNGRPVRAIGVITFNFVLN